MSAEPQPIPDGELVAWAPLGRVVRGGSWARQAQPTLDRIDDALAERRRGDAAALVRHLVAEATEIYELLRAWALEIPRILEREGTAPVQVHALGAELAQRTGAAGLDFDAAWAAFGRAAEETAAAALAASASSEQVERVVRTWTDAHDVQLLLVAGWVDAAVAQLGEGRLGELWAELQRDGIALYARYDLAGQPWATSFAQLVQIALEGMHAHFGGPRRRGEIELTEHADRVELRFASCGSGGQLVDREAFGTTTERHPFAWNEVGVCHYCVHCCVLQQLEPIRRLGYPARVIDPPLAPGDACTWTVYRDPSLVPDAAYLRVGELPPSQREDA